MSFGRFSGRLAVAAVTLFGLAGCLLPASGARAADAPQAAVAAPPPGEGPGVAGKVVSAGKPVPGVRVHAYPDAAGAFRGEGVASSGPTAADGTFFLGLAPGAYFLVVKGPPSTGSGGEPGAGDWFGYYGGNPVTIVPGRIFASNIQAARRIPPVVKPGGGGERTTVAGVVLGPDGPVEGASVSVYADASHQFRGPDLFGPQGAVLGGTDAAGAFSIEVPAGAYWLVATKRKGGASLGPLRAGDLYGFYDGNPLEVATGSAATVTIQVGEKLRDALLPAPGAGSTGIRGKIRDPEGRVPPGVYAFATTDPSFMVGSMPPYRSQPVGPDGVYFVEVPDGGTYYVSARSGYGGPPLPGEWHGFHGEGSPRPVAVARGAVTEGVDFVVKRME